ncbi:MAG: endonuclease/exonuclease/phosphatase family protein, partial [Ferruginibacter sp.]
TRRDLPGIPAGGGQTDCRLCEKIAGSHYSLVKNIDAAMTKLVVTIFKAINLFVIVLYLSACLIPVLPAGRFWMVAVLGLIFPLLFILVLLFLICWLIARSRWCLLSLVAIALSWQQLSAVVSLHGKKEFILTKNNETLRVLTWNTSSWGETSKSDGTTTNLPKMLETVKEQQADVLCFQEFWDRKSSRSSDARYSNIEEFKKMGYPYFYFAKTINDNFYRKMGVSIISKYPITDTVKFRYGEDDFAEDLIYADIQFNQQKIRIFTTHLQSVRFEQGEYSAISKIKRTDKSGLRDSKNIVRKLKNAYWYRGSQADLVKEKIKESPYPVIICGDFNDVPNSYTYFTIKGNLQDAFLKKGNGIGRTFQYLFPTLRIDYILADKNLDVEQFNRITVPYSDHYPVVADFSVKVSGIASK